MASKPYNKLPFLTKQIAKLAKKSLQIGVFDDSKRDDSDISNAELAIIHTYGTDTLPARPFLQPALKKHTKQYATALQALVAKAIKEAIKSGKEPNADELLANLAGRAINDVKQFIKSNQVKPPSSPETNARKGSNVTLIDTRSLVSSIEGRIV